MILHEGEFFDCRVYPDEPECAALDWEHVTIRFLFPDLVEGRLAEGDRFELRHAQILVADGVVSRVPRDD